MSTSTILNPTSATFDRDVIQSDQPVLVDFWAPWCGPCVAFKPTVEAVAKDRGVRTAFVNVDENPDLASRYSITSIPALKIIKGGKVVAEIMGGRSKAQLVGWLAQNGL